jgi:hypothetical protein
MTALNYLKTRSSPVWILFCRLLILVWIALACIASARPQSPFQKTTRALRSIDDQGGFCWLLIRDVEHPAGPGRLVGGAKTNDECLATVSDQDGERAASDVRPPLPPAIRGGDALIVEDDSCNAHARLAAVALGPAALGAEFRARLKIGGASIKVVALGPGRAKIATQIEVRQ